MGSKRNPAPGSLEQFLSKHDGENNAQTQGTTTAYALRVAHQHQIRLQSML